MHENSDLSYVHLALHHDGLPIIICDNSSSRLRKFIRSCSEISYLSLLVLQVLVEGENLLSLCTGLRYTFAVLVEEIDHELGYNRGPFPHVSPTSEVAASSSAKPTNAKGSSSDSSSSSSGSGAAEDNAACARAIAELRAAHWDNDLWALRASHIALLREGIVLVTQDLVSQYVFTFKCVYIFEEISLLSLPLYNLFVFIYFFVHPSIS